ncbi:hypothetical protein MNBD_GAMMA12-3417 [hydrothermal vent metagenome]|uniref:Uncharacterized protein n=1 Tax=hydrothermal vent metagenome TaxID=652676 RepID=A0A3B0YNS4_9ZZZZ
MFFLKIIMAALLVYLAIRLWPVAKEHYKNGPKGTSKQWINFVMLMGGMFVFVYFLISMVR